jgi:carboxymethylenebutenolidase
MAHVKHRITTSDGQADAHAFTPHSGSGPWPAVLVFMDGRGLRPALFELGQRLADAGYYVLLPDLFYRAGPYEAPGPNAFTEDPAFRKRWLETYVATVTPDHVRADTRAFLDFLQAQPLVSSPRIGTTGYCLGGALSLSAAGNFPDRVVAAASYHGGNLATDAAHSPHRLADKIKARVYVAGAIEDASFPDEQKERLVHSFADAGVEHRVETYEGARHGWVPVDSAVHNPEAAERHWRSLVALFDATLKPALAAQ